MAYDPNNIFARILRGEAPAHVVLDEAECMAFMDVMPMSPGHTLVIPREPAENLFALPAERLGPLAVATQRVARAVRDVFAPAGVSVRQLNGGAAGQSVFHIHFHVIPHYAGQALDTKQRLAEPRVLAQQATKLRAALAGER